MDYTRNEDKRCYNPCRENYIFSIKDNTSSITEPVTLVQMKDYLRLEGFQSPGEVADSFTFDNNLISSLIKSARIWIEKTANVSLVAHDYEMVFTNGKGRFSLPYGPVDEISSLKDSNGDDIEDYETVGSDRVYLKTYGEDMTMEYSTLPLEDERALTDIKRIVARAYKNRGDVNEVVHELDLFIHSYSRMSWLA